MPAAGRVRVKMAEMRCRPLSPYMLMPKRGLSLAAGVEVVQVMTPAEVEEERGEA